MEGFMSPSLSFCLAGNRILKTHDAQSVDCDSHGTFPHPPKYLVEPRDNVEMVVKIGPMGLANFVFVRRTCLL